ncbi:mitochondrial antiviral-signaling protein [Pempheris klunzingeri]|uniref:mitochondrial antiviral-signaling protein n=1 Tax=Pempheris klunzingeri TaxID=3127111 RepID=UPI0039807FC6
MSFANDQLFKGYLRRNMATIASTVKVREIVPHLPCLTDHDRENIEAKKETCGNYDSMVLLLDCLKRRQSWPEQFIQALEMCELTTLAAEIRAEYNALRGANNSSPSSPSTTVVRAHVHPAPPASHLSFPGNGGNNQAAVSAAAEPSAPPEPPAQAAPPLEAPQSSAAQVPEAVSQLEPPQIEVAAPPSTPPPSPETPHTQETATPPPQREISSHQEPVENSESDILDISGDNDGQESAVNGNESTDSVDAPQPCCPVEPTTTEVRPPQSPSPTSDVTDESSFPIMTPERPPIQDTAPPGDMKPAAVLQPEETSEPPAAQVVESSPQTETAATTSPLPPAAGMDASLWDDSLCLSKPGQLISIEQQNHSLPTLPAPSSPFSGNSERLEISEAAANTVTSAHVPACSAVSSTTVETVTVLENGIALNHNEPEENHYESPGQSLDMQDVRVHVGQISEQPSILNLDGQSSAPRAQIIHGEAAKEITCAPSPSTNAAGSVLSVNTPSSESHPPSEPAPADVSTELKTVQDSETPSCALANNTKYILTAVGVGACALLMAWKFKN